MIMSSICKCSAWFAIALLLEASNIVPSIAFSTPQNGAATSSLFRTTPSGPRTHESAQAAGLKYVATSTEDGLAEHSSSSASITEQEEDDASEVEDSKNHLGAWIPVGSAKALTGIGPQRIRVMGLDLVVWHKPVDENETKKAKRKLPWKKSQMEGAATEWSILADVCPHRLAPLSQGRVDPETGCIECPYHGWQFDGDGTLTSLPQMEKGRKIESVIGRGGNADNIPVHLCGDLIFAFLPTALHGESFPRSLVPEDMYPYLADDTKSGRIYFSRELPYSADFAVENLMDPSHIPFAHNKLQSVRDDGSPINMKLVAFNFTHIEFSFKYQLRGKKRLY